MKNDNVDTVNKMYNAFVSGDQDTIAEMISADYVLHVPGNGLNAGEYWGQEGFRRFMSNIAEHNGGVFDMDVPAFAANGEHVFTREVLRINRVADPERVFTLRLANWLKLRNGKLVESWVIPEDLRAYDEYWTTTDAYKPDRPKLQVQHRTEILDLGNAVSARNREIIENMYDRFWAGDANGMRTVISDDVVVNITGRSALSGEYHGWDGYQDFRARLMRIAGDKYHLDVVGLAAGTHNVFAVEYIRMNRAWDPQIHEIYVLMHFEMADGKIIRMNDFPLDSYAWERFYILPAAL